MRTKMPPNPNIAAIFLLWVAILSVATMGSAQPVTGAATAPGEEAATGPVTLSAVEYCAGHEYRNGVLERVHNDYGYWAGGRYHYYIKDYQGNVRAVIPANTAARSSTARTASTGTTARPATTPLLRGSLPWILWRRNTILPAHIHIVMVIPLTELTQTVQKSA